jgi:hypothetical protein
VVQAFLPDTPQEALTDRIASGSMNRRFEHLNRTSGRHTSKARPKFAIVITDQIFRRLSIGGGFSKLLCHPGISWRACHAHMDHLARLQFDDEEGKERAKKEISDRKARRRPRSVRRACAERSTTSGLVAAGYEPSSCTSGSCVCTQGCPVSTVPHECAQLPRADCPSPSA